MKAGLKNGIALHSVPFCQPASIEAADLQILQRSAQSLSIISKGITSLQRIALKVAKGEMQPAVAWAMIDLLDA